MAISCSDSLRLTHALLRPETVLAAVEVLRGATGQAEVEGLVELIHNPPTARAALAAISALEGCDAAIILDGLRSALDSPHSTVRLAAVQALQTRRVAGVEWDLASLLKQDESWLVRRAALFALAAGTGPDRWQVLAAADDPHWRVRHALIRVLLEWGENDSRRQEIEERLTARAPDVRVEGVRCYLHHRWSDAVPDDLPTGNNEETLPPFWDSDAAVLARELERMGEPGRRQAMDSMRALLPHADERVRGLAGDTLRRWGETHHFVQVLELLNDPRNGSAEAVTRLLGSLDQDQVEEIARFVLQMSRPTAAPLAWALDQVEVVFPAEDLQERLGALLDQRRRQPSQVRSALARLLSRGAYPRVDGWLWGLLYDDPCAEVQREALRCWNGWPGAKLDQQTLTSLLRSPNGLVRAEVVKTAVQAGEWELVNSQAEDVDARVRVSLAECVIRCQVLPELVRQLQSDPHPHVRVAALTSDRAAELVRSPGVETSWLVLASAARMMKVPFWNLEPEPRLQPVPKPVSPPEPLCPRRSSPVHARMLGPGNWPVSPLGISGHYGLPVEGLVRALEAGVNLFFWEPNYGSMTDFIHRLPRADRESLIFITGTFEADGKRVQRDAERALRLLRIERIPLFLLFWVQSWRRVTPDVRETLEQLRDKGMIAAFGLSTHSRPLAMEAMDASWNPVMVRHSAAHRGAEEKVLPKAIERKTSIVAFNCTCYGRLLKPAGQSPAPSVADCYRYTLSQPGVTACLSAPATLAQLDDNLAALRDTELPPERRERLLLHGDLVYREDAVFRKLVRSV